MSQKQEGKFIIYGYDSTGEVTLGHYIALIDGVLVDDAYKKEKLLRVEKLSNFNLKSIFFGENTQLIVYELI